MRVGRGRFLSILMLAPAGALGACGEESPAPSLRGNSVLSSLEDVDAGRVADGLRRKRVVTNSYRLGPNRINVHTEPFRVQPFLANERAWVRRWAVAMEYADGTLAPGDLQCHAILSKDRLLQQENLFRGLCTDGFTPTFELPDGFAIPVESNAQWLFQLMFNNRATEEREVRMRIDVDFLPDSERKQRLVPLKCFTEAVLYPQMYWVKPHERDVKTRTFPSPASGRVHAIGGHIHPYGKHLELVRESDGKVLHRATLSDATALEAQRLTTYSSKAGFYIREGELLRINAVYENPTDRPIDAMGGFFVFWDPDGKPGE